MVFGLLGKKCKICGEKIEKGKVIVRHGKKFCSDKHVEEYRQQLIDKEKSVKKRGGCCG